MERAEPLQGGTSTEGRVLGLRVTDCCRRTLQFYWEQLLLGIRGGAERKRGGVGTQGFPAAAGGVC